MTLKIFLVDNLEHNSLFFLQNSSNWNPINFFQKPCVINYDTFLLFLVILSHDSDSRMFF